MPPPNQVAESVLDEIDLDITDPFAEGDVTQYMSTTIPIPKPTPPPQHAGKCADETFLRMQQKANH